MKNRFVVFYQYHFICRLHTHKKLILKEKASFPKVSVSPLKGSPGRISAKCRDKELCAAVRYRAVETKKDGMFQKRGREVFKGWIQGKPEKRSG